MATRAWPFTTCGPKEPGTPTPAASAAPGPTRCYPAGQMLHGLGDTAALRGSRAAEQGELPIKRRSSFSLLEQLQHQMSRLWRQLPPRSSASPRPVHAREHSIGWKEGGGSSILAARPVQPPAQDSVALLLRAQAQIMNSRNCSSLFS